MQLLSFQLHFLPLFLQILGMNRGVNLRLDYLLRTSPEVIKTFFMPNSTEHEISTAHKTKMLKNKDFFADVVFIMLLNDQIPTIVSIY